MLEDKKENVIYFEKFCLPGNTIKFICKKLFLNILEIYRQKCSIDSEIYFSLYEQKKIDNVETIFRITQSNSIATCLKDCLNFEECQVNFFFFLI